MASPRIQIQDVQPQVDCGRYPVKACVGDEVPVTATIFRDGHDTISAVARYRPPGTRRWREAPLEPKGNDRYEAVVVPDAIGSWELRVQAWVDPFASWLDEYDRKLAAGQADLAGELSEGRALFGEGTVDEWRAAARKLSDRERRDAAKGPVLGIDVDRLRARFGAWYELFPRSWGGFRGVAAVLPDLAALGFDIVYLPPVHPIGETNRKGRNNAERARKGDSGSPWAIGGPDGGHDAFHRGARHRGRLRCDGRGGRGGRGGARARLRDPVLPRSPVARHASGVVPAATGRHDQVRREPAEALPGHPQPRVGHGRQGGFVAGAARHRARLVRARNQGVPGGQSPHEADAVLGVAHRPGARRCTRRRSSSRRRSRGPHR